MLRFFVFLAVVSAVCSEGLDNYIEYDGEPIEQIEKILGPTTFHLKAASSNHDVTADVTPVILASRNVIEDYIKDVLNSYRDVIVNGNEVLPPMDPLVVDHVGPFEIRETGLRASVNARNVRLEGLQWYTVDDVTFGVLRLAFGMHMTVPWIHFSSDYDANVRLALFITHSAAGSIRVSISRLEIAVDSRLGTNLLGGGHLTLRELDVRISVADVQIRFDGLTGSSVVNALINSYVQNLTRDIIHEQLDAFSKGLSEHLFEVINEILKQYTLDDLLGIGSKRA